MRVRIVLALLVLLGLGVGLASTASAATAPRARPNRVLQAADDVASVTGVLRNKDSNNDPVAGVTITVTKPDGSVAGTSVTDATGRWRVGLTAGGAYTVTIDKSTLPKGVKLTNGDSGVRAVQVPTGGLPFTVLFPIGKDTRKVASKISQVPNLVAAGLVFGLIISMAAIGLSLIFGTTGLTNFAHGEMITFGGVVALILNVDHGLNIVLAGAIAVILSGGLGWLLDAGLFGPLRRRNTGLIAGMIVSIGLALAWRYVMANRYGTASRQFTQFTTQKSVFYGLAGTDLWTAVISIVVLLGTGFVLLRTRIGKATRAVADNPALASATGINVNRVIRLVWVAGSGLAGLAGVELGLSAGLDFQSGFKVLLLVFAAVTLGGLGTAFGAAVGSLVVGLFVNLSTLFLPSDTVSQLKNVPALAILIIVLLIRPQGILGRRERVG